MHDERQRKGMERELSILCKLQHDTIIQPRAIVEGSMIAPVTSPLHSTAPSVFIEYSLYKGGNLAHWLAAEERKPWEKQSIARQLVAGLSYLHDHGIVHKDVKPTNVLMHEDGRLALADFDISKDTNEGSETSTQMAGTRGFMAPEVERGEPATMASDVYSYGVLLYFMHFPDHMSGRRVTTVNTSSPDSVSCSHCMRVFVHSACTWWLAFSAQQRPGLVRLSYTATGSSAYSAALLLERSLASLLSQQLR
jgi:serine/threonine protein kinase